MMERIEGNMGEPVSNVQLGKLKKGLTRNIQNARSRIASILFHQGFLLVFIGFLLGRALILGEVTPFALPFFAAVYFMKKKRAGLTLIALLVGSSTVSLMTAAYVFGGMILFVLLFRWTLALKFEALKALPFLVFLSAFLSKSAMLYFTTGIVAYDWMMIGVEAGLGFILTLIFFQSIPLIMMRKKRQAFKTEEIICLIILLASVLTGTIGWTMYDMAIEHILSRYLVLIFAFVAGATIGSTVGVVTGLILSLATVSNLYQMSLLAFAGLLGGLLREGNKLGVSVGLLLGTLLIGIYGEGTNMLMPTILESMTAVVLFLLTPQKAISNLAKFIPGTAEYNAEQQQYLRKIRDVTANRVEQFSHVFQALSSSFSKFQFEQPDSEQEMDLFLSNVTEKTCQNCFKKDQCWTQNFHKTYEYMTKLMEDTEEGTISLNVKLQKEWDRHCVKSEKVKTVIKHELTQFHASEKLKKQLMESRRLVADQLLGVSQVMEDFAKEIQRERENHYLQEDQILDALQAFGIQIEQVEIYSVEQGNVDIEMTVPYCQGRGECEKLIAPMLSDILNENIMVKKEECNADNNGYCYVSFGSAKAFTIDTGVAHAAKGGGLISGDSFSTIELGHGKFAIAISDGMGNGERAHYESKETLKLLQEILQSGIKEKVAIKSVNSVLSLRTTDEIFTTLDLAMIDLQDASAKFLKVGSTPSFVKRGDRVLKIEASNLPMGIIQEFDVDVVSEQLKAGDLLIMMSDGIFEGPKHVENYDLWMKRKVSEIQTDDPQEVADIIMEEVIRTRSGQIQDDMTVVVAKVERNIPKWAAIPAYHYLSKNQGMKEAL
ncbi:stage II sporulation protein E [Bacillus tianshenii]|uniref:Stage II sporulation protein E n=2 Tax=Sutcliffiella tianshenii TaxID=1463404 RepID=A0ABS2P5Q6_9BACI|nr:stage II sporulation protein E [Bacillus tianshenii]